MSVLFREVYEQARELLGEDFIAPEYIMRACAEVIYTDMQLDKLAQSLPSLDVLIWCSENDYVVIPAPPNPLSARDVLSLKRDVYLVPVNADSKKTSFGWLMVKRVPVKDSLHKSFNEQQALLAKTERVPTTAEMCWLMTMYFEVRKIRLFEKLAVWTLGHHPRAKTGFSVGLFRGKVLGPYLNKLSDRYEYFGLSAALR